MVRTLALDGPDTHAEPKVLRESHAQCQEAAGRTEARRSRQTEDVPEDMRRVNTTWYLEYLGMVKIERKLMRKIHEDPGPRPPAPPPSSRGASCGASEVTSENLLAATEELRDRQDKLSGATAALIVAVKEAGEGPWEAGPGLTEEALLGWLEKQVDRMKDLKESLDQKRSELVRRTQVEEEEEIAGSQTHNPQLLEV